MNAWLVLKQGVLFAHVITCAMTLAAVLREDLAASLSRAAAARHATHIAFGRRIRQLEAGAGTKRVEHGRLTPAGQELLDQTQPCWPCSCRCARA